MNFHRVVEFIGLGQNLIRFVNTPENEMFVKPGQMPDLPEQWIDDVEPRLPSIDRRPDREPIQSRPLASWRLETKVSFVSLSLISQQSIGRS